MISKIAIIVASYVAAVQACTGASGMPNPVTQPTQDKSTWPTIGQPYTVKWKTYAQESPSITLSLYNGCPNNCKEITDIGPGIQSSKGSLSWTPADSLKPGNDYGILFINENPCLTAWAYFGLNPVGTPVGAGAAGNDTAAASSAVSAAVVGSAAPSAAGTGASAAAAQPSVITSRTTAWYTVTVTGDPPGSASAAMAPAASGAAAAPPVQVETITVYDTVTVYGPSPAASTTKG